MSESFSQSVPAEVVGEVFGGYAVELCDPFFESAVIGIDVLDVINAADHALACGKIDGAMGNMSLFGNGSIDGCAIGAQ